MITYNCICIIFVSTLTSSENIILTFFVPMGSVFKTESWLGQ